MASDRFPLVGEMAITRLTALNQQQPADIQCQDLHVVWGDAPADATLPEWMDQLTTVGKLSLSGFPGEVPPVVWRMTWLYGLVLDACSLTAVPGEIEHLLALEELNLSENLLTTLPVEIGRLKR